MTYFDIGRSFQGHFDITKYVQSPKRCQIYVNVVMMMINSLFRNFFCYFDISFVLYPFYIIHLRSSFGIKISLYCIANKCMYCIVIF